MPRRTTRKLFFFIVLLFIFAVGAHLFYLNSMTARETYPVDTYLDHVFGKRAMIVTAHDDDAYSFAGTIAKLTGDSWDIRQISFKMKDSLKNELFYELAKNEELEGVDLIEAKYRNDLETNKMPYMPIPYEKFPSVFNHDTIYHYLSSLIDNYQPDIIFTLDDIIGGYGHPDHVFISKLVVEYCNRNKNNPGFSVKRIYQSVFPPSMAENFLVKNSWSSINPYLAGKKIYQCQGMPNPDVYVFIYPWGRQKKEYMNSFDPLDRKYIAKFSPGYNWYPYWIYFKIFNKEYFRVIQVTNEIKN
ncbi:MAG: PIG-L family deacetylase [Bacteroidetes bacterium]|nr:PIG-L family deacetylase [Bacteroidota bacterium]